MAREEEKETDETKERGLIFISPSEEGRRNAELAARFARDIATLGLDSVMTVAGFQVNGCFWVLFWLYGGFRAPFGPMKV